MEHHHWMNHIDQLNELRYDEGEEYEALLSMDNVDDHILDHYIHFVT